MKQYALLFTLLFLAIPTLAIIAEDKAPHVALPLLEDHQPGKTTGINDYKGKLVYLDFWASWCGPCRQSFPFLKQLKEQYAEQGFEVVSVNVDTSLEPALKFLKDHPVNHPILLDPNGKMAERYGVQGLPTAFIIDRDGVVVYKHLGFKEKDKAWITALVRQNLGLE